MPILFHYLLHLFLVGLLRVFGGFVGLFFLIDGVESIRRFSQKSHFNWPDMFLLMASRIPSFITMLFPSLALLATLMVLTRLSHQNEITVMRASGVSMPRILIPFLLGGVIVASVHVVMQDQIVPRSNRAQQKFEDRITNREESASTATGNLWLRSGQQIIHARQVVPSSAILLEVTVFQFDDQHNLTGRVDARAARLKAGQWELMEGVRYRFGGLTEAETFRIRPWDVHIQPDQLDRSPANPKFLTLRQLGELAQRLESEGYDATGLRVLLYTRIAHPATTIAAILLAFPFTLRLPRQGGVARSTLMGLALGFAMFVVVDLFAALGSGGRVPPLVAAWAPVLFFVGIGGYLMVHIANPRRDG